MGAGKRHSLHKYGIRPSACAVSGVSVAFTPRWNFFTLVPITAVRASLLISLQNAFLRFERWRLSSHLPIHPPHWNKYASISPHCAAPALSFFIRFESETQKWGESASRFTRSSNKRRSAVRNWRRSPGDFSQTGWWFWNRQNAGQNISNRKTVSILLGDFWR